MSGSIRRAPGYRGRVEPEPGDWQDIRPGRSLSVAHRHGSGDTTLVFVHGTGGARRQFARIWTHYAATDVTLLAWDAYGHGQSPRFDPQQPEAMSGTALLDDFEVLLNRHAVGTTIVIGHSFGARLVLAMLLRLAGSGRLQQVDAALLLAPASLAPYTRRGLFGPLAARLPGRALEVIRPLAGRLFRRRAWHPKTDRALIRAERGYTRGNTLAMIAALLTQAPTVEKAEMQALTLPVDVLAGEAERLVPREVAGSIVDSLPDARLEVVPGAGHQIMIERPDACIAAIEALRARVKR